MGIFSFLNRKKEMGHSIVPFAQASELMPSVEDVTNKESSAEKKSLTVSYATGWPIDIIYGYLHKNYEEKGFDDAMVKSDFSFRDMNMNIIKNKILMVFREINLNYDVMMSELQTKIETCSAAGLLTTVCNLEKTMTTINTHKAELKLLEADFKNNGMETSVPLQSYDCGFLRGIATIALGTTSKSTGVLPYSQTNKSNDSKVSA